MSFSTAKNISHRFTLWLAIIIATTLAIFFVAFITYDARTTEQGLYEQADHILSFSKQALESAMWQYNNEYVESYMDSLFLYDDIVFAYTEIEEQEIGQKSSTGYEEIDFHTIPDDAPFIVRDSTIVHDNDEVGRIFFVMSKERVARQVIRNSLAAMALLLMVALIISLTMIVLFRKNILNPLVELDASARKIAGGALDTPIDTGSEDEIGQLAGSFSRMMHTIRAITASRDELNAEIAERKRAETIITENLREKEVLLQEIHHRVKNNLQMTQSLLSIQTDKIDDPALKQPLIEANSRIKSMALIHETLYRSKDIARLDVKSYFQSIIEHLRRAYTNPALSLDIHLDVDPLDLQMDHCISCGLILNELISNTFKYAFSGRSTGTLNIGLSSTDGINARLSVIDDGVGLPPSLDPEAMDSMGLRIVRILVEGQLKGTMATKTNDGANFLITFPIPPNRQDKE